MLCRSICFCPFKIIFACKTDEVLKVKSCSTQHIFWGVPKQNANLNNIDSHTDHKHVSHANTYAAAFKWTSTDSSWGDRQGGFRVHLCRSGHVVNSPWHRRVNAPLHSSLNNLWAASWTGLNGLLAPQRCTLCSAISTGTHFMLLGMGEGTAMMKEKQGHKSRGCITDFSNTCDKLYSSL